MWVETEAGAVNIDFVTQMMVEADDSMPGAPWVIGFWTNVGGYARGQQHWERRKEAVEAIRQITEDINYPPRVVRLGTDHEQVDTQGEGPHSP